MWPSFTPRIPVCGSCYARRASKRLIFDLGLRRDVKHYPLPIQKHIEARQPMSTDPDVTKSLAKGGLTPNDIDCARYIGTMLENLKTFQVQPSSSDTAQLLCSTALLHSEVAIPSSKATSCRKVGQWNYPNLLCMN